MTLGGALPTDDPVTTRYEDRGPIGRGGMGEVRRVFDRHLDRVLAMKVLSEDLVSDDACRSRFLAEARLTAQLQHPAIVAVHDRGAFADGRLWFTMREVRGRTLGDVIEELHFRAREGAWPTEGEVTLHRVVDSFRRLCDGVAYAHSRGVVHRDLKPSNLMVGEFGEVQVMDWGLAKHAGEAETARESVNPEDSGVTQDGDIVGTPSYMSPEQARAENATIDARSDVWALGACLRTILTNRPPVEGPSAKVLTAILLGNIRRVEDVVEDGHPPLPRDLLAICAKAMRIDPLERHRDAGAFAADLGAWLEGVRRRERALAIVDEAEKLEPEIRELRDDAARLREEAEATLRALPYTARAEEKHGAWELEDRAKSLERDASLREVEWLQRLRSALEVVPDFDEAHLRLAEHYRARLLEADARRDANEAARCEALLRAHDRGVYARFLRGEGRVTVITDPPGARVTAYRYVEERRRLVPGEPLDLGATPVRGAALAHGSYLIELGLEGRPVVRYPVLVERGQHWDGAPPGETEPLPIPIPTAEEIGAGRVYVPAGWFWSGGDPQAGESLKRRRVWVDAMMVARDPVTNAELLEYVNRLVAEGRAEEAASCVPQSPTGDEVFFVGPDAEGRYRLPDTDDPQWHPRSPASYVSWYTAVRFAEASGGRLPDELEWEKCARGVDGRPYACGDHVEPSWVTIAGSTTDVLGLRPVDSTPVDESPYGVRGTIGNVREWCANAWRLEGPTIEGERLRPGAPEEPSAFGMAARGGSFHSTTEVARAACRFAGDPERRHAHVGFRVVRSYP